MVIVAAVGYSLLIIFDLKPLYQQKLWRDFWANGILFAISFTIALLISLKVTIPSPEEPIRQFITSIFGK